MKKIVFIIFFFFIILAPKVFALDLFPKIKINQSLFDVLTAPTATPTQSPTQTPAPTIQPTEEPTPTEAPIPTETPTPTQLEIVTETSSPQPSSTPLQKTPTPTQQSTQNLNQKEIVMYGVIGFLVLIVLLQNFPKIKKWLHEKTA